MSPAISLHLQTCSLPHQPNHTSTAFSGFQCSPLIYYSLLPSVLYTDPTPYITTPPLHPHSITPPLPPTTPPPNLPLYPNTPTPQPPPPHLSYSTPTAYNDTLLLFFPAKTILSRLPTSPWPSLAIWPWSGLDLNLKVNDQRSRQKNRWWYPREAIFSFYSTFPSWIGRGGLWDSGVAHGLLWRKNTYFLPWFNYR